MEYWYLRACVLFVRCLKPCFWGLFYYVIDSQLPSLFNLCVILSERGHIRLFRSYI